MSNLDWIVACLAILFIVIYGIWRSRSKTNIESYLLADRQMKWYNVGLSVMATQASAITYLSLPGQAYTNGMGFIQTYLGLPLAVIIICITFIPIYKKLNVYTAYEFLENRFDYKTRAITSGLFLIQRGISTGITIYAPAIIISALLNIDVFYTTLFSGILVLCYTIFGGVKTVSYSQTIQMVFALSGLVLAAVLIIQLLPENNSFGDALYIAGKLNKLNPIDFSLDANNKYTVWTGLIGGLFLQLSYFGTDQSQVGRYLTAGSVGESRLGLLMNGFIKIPMQFLILLIGVLVFIFHQYNPPQIFINPVEITKLEKGIHADSWHVLKYEYDQLAATKKQKTEILINAMHNVSEDQQEMIAHELREIEKQVQQKKIEVVDLLKKNNPDANTDDSNYIFLDFVLHYFPKGLVGLILAIIFLAAMSATASGINGLTSVTIIDYYKRIIRRNASEKEYYYASVIATAMWCVFCTVIAFYAGKWGNLIEAVNILGSLVYGVILGVFLVALYIKPIRANAVFYAAIVTEIFIIVIEYYDWIAFLWLNIVGCICLIALAILFQILFTHWGKRLTPTPKF